MPPAPISATTLTDALRWRYATKKFDPARKIPDATWAALEEALVLSPSSYGLQPWRFVVVRDPATKERLAAVSWDQRQPADCSHFVVFAGRKAYSNADLEHYLDKAAEVRGVAKESLRGYANVMLGNIEKARAAGHLDTWFSRQVYIALGQFMTSAALLGVDTCPMEGFEPQRYNEILGLAELGYEALCAGAAGYRSADDKYSLSPKVRFVPEEVVIHV